MLTAAAIGPLSHYYWGKTAIDSPKCQGEAERLREQLLSLGLQDHKTS